MSRAEAFEMLCFAAEHGWISFCAGARVHPDTALRTMLRLIRSGFPSGSEAGSAPCSKNCGRLAWPQAGHESAVCYVCARDEVRAACEAASASAQRRIAAGSGT